MKRLGTWFSGLALAVLAAGCGDARGEGGITPVGPMLLVGPTTTVTVSCPTQMEASTSGTCTAYGYDAYGSFTNSSASSWASSNTSVATMSSTGAISAVSAGTATITAVVDGVSGSTSVSVVNPTPFQVTVNGLDLIPANETCVWYATVSGGTPPYTYDWRGGTPVAQSGHEYWASATSSFDVKVRVTDANGNLAYDYLRVTVGSGSGPCPI